MDVCLYLLQMAPQQGCYLHPKTHHLPILLVFSALEQVTSPLVSPPPCPKNCHFIYNYFQTSSLHSTSLPSVIWWLCHIVNKKQL